VLIERTLTLTLTLTLNVLKVETAL